MLERDHIFKWAIIYLVILSFNNYALAGKIIYVDNDGPADFNTIQAAIDDANDGDTIIVLPGTYTGDGNRDISFNGKAITVQGIDPNDPDIVENTIIDCNGDGSNWHRGFIFNSLEDANSIIRGLTITGGCALEGAGIYIENSGPVISNCIIKENSCKADEDIYRYYAKKGGGIYINGGKPIISDCCISYNISAHGLTRGGGIYCMYAQPVISKCIINNNQIRNNGGGIYLSSCTNFLIEESIICGNIVTFRWAGGIDISDSQGDITNCVIAENQSSYGGAGLNLYYSDVNIVNCTIANNYSSLEGGGGLNSSLTHINILNSIIWGNKNRQNTQIYIDSWSGIYDGPSDPTPVINASLNISFCDIQNDQNGIYISGEPEWLSFNWGDGNIDSDPLFADPNDDMYHLFADPNNGDYHLMSQAGRWTSTSSAGADPNSQTCPCTEPGAGWVLDDVTSPCIDAGDPNSPIGLEPFPNGTTINMGAYGGTEQASKSLSDVLFFSDFWPFEIGNRWWNAYVISDGGIDYEITENLDSNGFEIWHFEYDYPPGFYREVPPNDYYWVYVNDGLYNTYDINDIDSLPNITGQMKLQSPEKINPNEPIFIPRFKSYGNVIALRGTLEEVLDVSQTNPEIPEYFMYDVNDFPAGNHGNVLAFAEDSNEGTTLIELYGYHFGPMLQGIHIMDGNVAIDTLVKITNPTENEIFNRFDTIEVAAEVAHTTSPVIKMEFVIDIYIPQIQIGTDIDSSDGWSVQWKIPFGGNLPLRVRATTESGMRVISKPVYIKVQ